MSSEYRYTKDLMELNSCRRDPPGVVPGSLCSQASPLRWLAWQVALRSHPDQEFTQYIVNGIREGFLVGFQYSSNRCRLAGANMGSALERPDIGRDYLAKECAEGRVLGPFPLQAFPGVQVSRFGVIPKGKSGKWWTFRHQRGLASTME